MPNSARDAEYKGYWGMGIITPGVGPFPGSMNNFKVARIPSDAPAHNMILSGLDGIPPSLRLMYSEAWIRMISIPLESLYDPGKNYTITKITDHVEMLFLNLSIIINDLLR